MNDPRDDRTEVLDDVLAVFDERDRRAARDIAARTQAALRRSLAALPPRTAPDIPPYEGGPT